MNTMFHELLLIIYIISSQQIQFHDVFGEPRGARSIDVCWDMFKEMFNCCRSCMYGIFTLFCAPCIAGAWGCEFGITALIHIWVLTPTVKSLTLCITDVFQRLFDICCDCCVSPLTEAIGGLFINCQDPNWKPRDRSWKVKPKVAKKPKPKKEPKSDPEPEVLPVFVSGEVFGDGRNKTKSIQRQFGLYL